MTYASSTLNDGVRLDERRGRLARTPLRSGAREQADGRVQGREGVSSAKRADKKPKFRRLYLT
jgi:hypothetical protein